MNLTDFHKNIEQVWTEIEEQLEEQGCDVDCDSQGAVLSLTFDDRSQIIINKQEPMLEMWLASRLGGLHFAYKNGEWINSDGENFWQCLEAACRAHGEDVHFNLA